MCRDCAKRAQCAQPCEKMEKELAKVTRHSKEIEIPVSHEVLKNLYTTRNVHSLANLQGAIVEVPLEMAASMLTKAQAEVFLLFFREKMTVREIALSLRISRPSAFNRLENAKKRLKKMLNRSKKIPDKPRRVRE